MSIIRSVITLKIVEDQTLRMENVLSYRRELTPSDFKMAVKEINTLITELNATKTGHTVTVNHVVSETRRRG